MRFGLWFGLMVPAAYFVIITIIRATGILDMDDFKAFIRDATVCMLLVILTVWSYNRCENLTYSINNDTYGLTKFSEKDGGGYYKYEGENVSVLVKTGDGCSEIKSIPTDTVKFNYSDNEEPSVTISKKEYNLNTLDKIATLDIVEDDGDIEKAVLTIPKE